MKLTHVSFQPRSSFALAAVALGMALLAGPTSAASTAATPDAAPAHAMTVASHTAIDTRISSLHTRLQITAAQEPLWQPVAQVMRDNAAAMDLQTQSRNANASGMTAVDDLHAYAQAIDTHADGIKKLTPVFEALYDGMSATQKHNADLIFRNDHHLASKKG